MELHHSSGLYGRSERELTSHERLLLAGLKCFVERGYHGTTIRQIATRAGVSVPGLYHHFQSKLAMLEGLIDDTMDDLLTTTEHALSIAQPDPVARFTTLIDAHVRFHCERAEESFVGNTELRSLSVAAYRRIVSKRDHQQRRFDELISFGVETEIFRVPEPLAASRAIVTMCTGVAYWFKRSGPLHPDHIVELYRVLALNALGFQGPVPAAPLRVRVGA